MNKLFYYCLIALAFFLYSCETEQYSCNADADAWVKQNISQVRKMTRSDWLQLAENEIVKRAAYVAFSSDQKLDFWEDKLREVVSSYNWNEKETKHIISLLGYIRSSQMFEKKRLCEKDEIFLYKWSDYAKTELGWSKQIIYAVAGDGNSIYIDTKENLHISNPYMAPQDTEFKYANGTCSCSFDSDFCDIFGEIPSIVVSCNNNNYNCTATDTGCGLMWSFPCTGICKSPIA